MKAALYARVSAKEQSCQRQLRDSRFLFPESRKCSYSPLQGRETLLKQSSLILKYFWHGISFKSVLAEKSKA